MDPLESAKCPQCSEVYSVRGLHFCQKGRQALDIWADPQRYAQYGAVSFQVVVLQNKHCEHGEQQNERDLVLGGSDGRVVIDIIKATALVRWTTKTAHPKAGEHRNGNGYGDRYPDTITNEYVEPHECLIAVIGESKDKVVAELRQQLEEQRDKANELWHHAADAKKETLEATKKVEFLNNESKGLMEKASRWESERDSYYKAATESGKLVKELQAELARIKTKVGTERFDELRKA